MTFFFDANGSGGHSGSIPATGAELVFRLKALLVTAGWVVTQSCDGPVSGGGGGTYSGSSDILTLTTSGAGGLLNPYAWFVVEQPSPKTRQLLFQCGSAAPGSGAQWRIKYSAGTGFNQSPGPQPSPYGPGAKTTGVPDLTSTGTPWATDEVILLGGGDDIVPTFAALLPADGTYRMNAFAGNSASNAGFMYWTNTSSNSWVNSTFVLDVLQPGTYVSADSDPSVIYLATSASDSILNTDLLNGSAVGNLGGTRVSIPALSFNTPTASFWPNQGGSSGGGPNQFTSKDDFSPLPYGVLLSAGPPSGWKGVSSFLYWNSVSRPYGNPFQVVTAKDYIAISGDHTGANNFIVIPWNGTTLTI